MASEKTSLTAQLAKAIRDQDSRIVEELLLSKPNILATPHVTGPWMNLAAAKGSTDILKTLVEFGADPNEKDKDSLGNSLDSAAAAARLDNAEALLKAGAEMDISEPTGNPLFSAIFGRSVEVAKLLLDAGINSAVRYETEFRQGPYHDALSFALERGEREIARLIALHQADGDTADAQRRLTEAWEVMKLNNPHDDGSPYLPAPMIDGSERLPS